MRGFFVYYYHMADTRTTTRTAAKPDTAVDNKSAEVKQPENKADAVESKETVQEPEPSLKDDYELLKNMNLLRNIMVRAQYGRFPDKKIDALLKRRMDIDESKFQGPRIVRIIISIIALFLFCTILYLIIFLVSKGLNLPDVATTASLVISLFFFSGLGFVIFNNLSVPDENKLKVLIKERMTELEVELKVDNKFISNDNTDKQKK